MAVQVICWVLGEYATTDGHMATDDVLAKLCDIASSHEADDSVRVSTFFFFPCTEHKV